MLVRLILLFAFITLSGCAVFPKGEIQPVSYVKPAPEVKDKKSLSYKFNFARTINMAGDAGTFADKEKQRMIKVFEESGAFSSIKERNDTADVKLVVNYTVVENEAALLPAFITGFSLYTIPSWATMGIKIEGTVSKGANEVPFEFYDESVLVQWLPMLFVFPFKNFTQMEEVSETRYTQIINMAIDSLVEQEVAVAD